jgi:hypothetical protein
MSCKMYSEINVKSTWYRQAVAHRSRERLQVLQVVENETSCDIPIHLAVFLGLTHTYLYNCIAKLQIPLNHFFGCEYSTRILKHPGVRSSDFGHFPSRRTDGTWNQETGWVFNLLYHATAAGCFRAGNSGRQIALAGNFGYWAIEGFGIGLLSRFC